MPLCVLTLMNYPDVEFVQTSGPIVEYKFMPIGVARIAYSTYISLQNQKKTQPILAAICRNRFDNGEEPILITQEFIDTGINKLDYPKEFKEKAFHLLNYMYNKGGKSYHDFDFESTLDYPIAYADDDDEFKRIIKFFDEKKFIKHWAKPDSGRFYIHLSKKGIREAEKELPKFPLFGLINQKISTGDPEVDSKINHAKDLFHHEPPSMDKMRSACETLSFVLEPLRKELETSFSRGDVQDFFNIVNNFDVRHNKDHTKALNHSEQLEWIYYSLLNTINTYTKLTSKIKTKGNL